MSIFPDRLNDLSAKIGQLRKERREILGRLASIDIQMRQGVFFELDILESQLELIKGILSQQPEERDYQTATAALQGKISELKEQNVQLLKNVLGARDAHIADGAEVDLDPAEKQRLEGAFIQAIEKVIVVVKERFPIPNPLSDEALKHAQKMVEERHEEQQRIYLQLLDSKTALNTAALDLEDSKKLKSLEKERKELLSDKTITDIWKACELGALDYVRDQVAKLWGFQKAGFINQRDAAQQTLVHCAAAFGHAELLRFLLQNGGDVTLRDSEGYQPLHCVGANGNIEVAQVLLEFKAPLDATGAEQRTALHRAAFHGHGPLTTLLLERGANVNAQESHGETALHQAISMGRENIISILLAHPKIHVSRRTLKGHTPLYYAIDFGLPTAAALIIGHSSWEKITDATDPNHFKNLSRLPSAQSQEMKNFLLPFVKQ